MKKENLNKKIKAYSSINKGFREAPDTKEGEGILYIEGYASKSLDSSNNKVIDFDGEFVDIKGFDLSPCKSLLFNHNHNELKVGTCRLEHRRDGAYLYGEVHEKMSPQVYYAVKHGLMEDFSIGFVATEATYKDINGEDVLHFDKGWVYETSICNVIGANPLAKLQATKSLKEDSKAQEVAKWLIQEDKEQNKEQETEETIIKKFDKQKFKEDFKKGLTIQETSEERWNIGDDFWQMYWYFQQTLSDNFDTLVWNDEFSKDEMLANMEEAFEIFKETAIEVATAVETKREKSLDETSENEVKTKTVETETNETKESTEAPKEVKEETPKEEVTETEVKTENIETEVQATEVKDNESENKPEVSEAEVKTETPEKVSPKEETQTEVKEETKPTETKEEVQEVSFAKPTLNDTLALLNEANLDELPAEDIERIYNDSGALMEKIEEMVKADLSA